MSISVNQIKQFAVEVDKKKNKGNGNHTVDTQTEIELFKKKVKTIDRNVNVDEILENYADNKTQMEADFDLNKTKSDSSVSNAIISAFNADSILNANDKYTKMASTIKEGIKNSDEDTQWWNPTTWFNDNGDFELFSPSTWFNNEEEVLDYTSMIDASNVLEVVEDSDVIEKINESDEEVKAQAGSTIVTALIEAAAEKQIDVSHIVAEDNGEYVVGREVPGCEFGSSLIEGKNFTAVVDALKKAVKNGQKNVAGEDTQKAQMLSVAAKRIDANGNGNGYIDTDEETEAIKQFAAEHGYDINTVLEEIRDNETNGIENTTELQKTVFNIFDPEQRAAQDKKELSDSKDVSKAIGDGIGEGDNEITDFFTGAWDSVASWVTGIFGGDKVDTTDGNKELLDNAVKNVNSTNVMTVLNENPGLIDKLVNKYDHNALFNLFGMDDTSSDYTTPILEALIQCAQENNIEIDDIVMLNGNEYVAGSAVSGVRAGSEALDEDNVAKVIKAIQDRINAAQA